MGLGAINRNIRGKSRALQGNGISVYCNENRASRHSLSFVFPVQASRPWLCCTGYAKIEYKSYQEKLPLAFLLHPISSRMGHHQVRLSARIVSSSNRQQNHQVSSCHSAIRRRPPLWSRVQPPESRPRANWIGFSRWCWNG